ncbi:hypothetical protein LAZ67_18001762 [Cordylochernes scorpioides]|uniref:Uncharacterized protein n=1 Tax=Cordylochernes scorpioides TaxID=51811 RepID=A0ABY6LG62_9ARAC|nr:hypothetical protein LAZ67_18001762 [Cordylochernes scorpioides]
MEPIAERSSADLHQKGGDDTSLAQGSWNPLRRGPAQDLHQKAENAIYALKFTHSMAGNMPILVPASSPEKAESVPERPSFVSQTGDEISPKNILQKKTSRENFENQKHAKSPAGIKHANSAAAPDVTAPITAAATSARTNLQELV